MIAMVHGAGPCPVPVKEAIIEWFGPIVFETYASTEGFGSASISATEWLAHKGSVGKPMFGAAHIVDDETGEDVGTGEIGTIYFENPRHVEYLNDQEKTRSVHHPKGWATAGDIGYLDADGYLYLTDRKADMIISGGVNIYPQEIESVLILHPKIADIAVFGVPNDEFGEEVKAVVAPAEGVMPGPELAAEIIAFCKTALSPIKAPRSVDFLPVLPRHETGKLYKRLLREPYWAGKGKNIN
jgi:long-chain acyl-CoA synthetase